MGAIIFYKYKCLNRCLIIKISMPQNRDKNLEKSLYLIFLQGVSPLISESKNLEISYIAFDDSKSNVTQPE